jgi:hypothetical protein
MRPPAWRKMSGPAPVLPDLARALSFCGCARGEPGVRVPVAIRHARPAAPSPEFDKVGDEYAVTQAQPASFAMFPSEIEIFAPPFWVALSTASNLA